MSKKGHVPVRMCIGCRGRKKKQEMLRFIRGPGDTLRPNGKTSQGGRGLYLCPNVNCLKLARKRSQGGRALGTTGLPVSLEWVLSPKNGVA